jgi:hypothetical protein
MSKAIRNYWRRHTIAIALFGCLAIALSAMLLTTPGAAQKKPSGSSGTTLAAVKTIDICSVDETTWRYSGEIAIWNQGAIATTGLAIDDEIQNKCGAGQFQNVYHVTNISPAPHDVAPGTTQATADLYTYVFEGAPLTCDIRNVANITITNHSGNLGVPFGPSPKATFSGTVQPCGGGDQGCTLTQGYWGDKPDVVWPSPYDRNATFFLSGQTWQQVLDTPVNVSQGYYQLAHQYIAAVLNLANGAVAPAGVQTVLTQAENWLSTHVPGDCTAGGSCGDQKDWAAILASFNEGTYPGGPPHCDQ